MTLQYNELDNLTYLLDVQGFPQEIPNIYEFQERVITHLDVAPSSSSSQSGFSDECMSPEIMPMQHQPRLQIVDQPQKLFRFRYIKESTKPHGPLRGAASENSSRQLKTGPKVRLHNFNGEAIIRCWLTNVNTKCASPHQLVGQTENGKITYEPHDIVVNSANNYTASFDKLNIIHVVSKNKSYCKYYEQKKMHICSGFKAPAQLNFNYETTVKEIKSLEKNMTSLYFQVFVKEMGQYRQIAETISDPIKNKKNPKTNNLRICRACSVKGSCEGGQEVFLFVEKVVKAIKIRFFEEDEETNEEIWSAYAQFDPLDIHHQVAIAIRTPRYKNTDITEEVKVYFQLERESDGAVSPRVTYYYTPSENRLYSDSVSKKRKICSLEAATNLIPMSVEEQMFDFNDRRLFSPPQQTNQSCISLDLKDLDQYIFSHFNEKELPEINEFFLNTSEIAADSFVSNSQVSSNSNKSSSEEEVHHKLKKLLHQSIEENNKLLFMQILSKCIAERVSLESKNSLNKTPLQMAVIMRNIKLVQMLLKAGCNCEAYDADYNTALHLAIIHFPESVTTLLKHVSPGFQEKCNREGDNLLLLGARLNNIQSVQLLVTNKWDPNFQNLRTGDAALHIAAKHGHENIVDLLLKNEAEPNYQNSAGYTPFHYAASAGFVNILRRLFATGIQISEHNTENNNDGDDTHNKILKGPNIFDLAANKDIEQYLQTYTVGNERSLNKNQDLNCLEDEQNVLSFIDSHPEVACELAEKMGLEHLVPVIQCTEKESVTKPTHILIKGCEDETTDPVALIMETFSEFQINS
ncbi:nuclear factor NF-kappa-B p105 subunit isoform X2 [Cimex lectularius]|uniref:RHD domain-containing protein n=1 Tax=Cimex lectularius TaxID=79782 RepID=A0A8I6SMU6_CIMLE|nr:nuclear factor NF-kappa-B p105 subunit isoform X2 [Cimex lectularius]